MIYTSYFYQVRNFPQNAIPLSTAVWDPKWFHDFKSQSYTFIDSRGIINGLRASMFTPGPTCAHLCRGPLSCPEPKPPCPFLDNYAAKLQAIPITSLLEHFVTLTPKVRELTHFSGTPDFIFLVHEAPSNICSERATIQNYFISNGIICREWHPNN